VALMRDVCQVERLQSDAAERMAQALLGQNPEFVQLASGHWALAASAGTPPAASLAAARAPAAELPMARLADIAFSVVDV